MICYTKLVILFLFLVFATLFGGRFKSKNIFNIFPLLNQKRGKLFFGGVDAKGRAVDNRTDAQKAAQIVLLRKYKAMFPSAKIVGHRDFLTRGKPNWKECPSFDVATWLATPEVREALAF